MRATDAAWLAGLYDGEGHITVTQQRRPNGGTQYIAIAVLGMVHEPTGDYVQALLDAEGLRYSRAIQRRPNPLHHEMWRIEVRRQETISALASIVLPYSVTKRAQWEATAAYARARAGRRGTYSAEDVALAEAARGLRLGPAAR